MVDFQLKRLLFHWYPTLLNLLFCRYLELQHCLKQRDKIKIFFGDILVAENGWVAPNYSEELGAQYMKNTTIKISVDLGLGEANTTFWTCDFTNDYISINADYRS